MPEIFGDKVDSQKGLLYTIRSEEVQEIMGRMPSWIIRRGISLMAVIILGLFALAWFFKYPDIIPAKVTILSQNPPIPLVAKNNLPIQHLLVENNQTVTEDQILAILSNPAEYQEVEEVAVMARAIDTTLNLASLSRQLEMPAGLKLGELQALYIQLFHAVHDYRFFLEHHSYGVKIKQLEEQSTYQSKRTQALRDRSEKLARQLAIQEKRFATDSSLVAATIMSRVEYENALKELIGQQMNTDGSNSEIMQSMLQQKEISASITEARIQWDSEKNALEQAIREAARQFNGALSQWEHNYVIRSPIAGTVTFFKYWKENQFVQAGEPVMVVTPPIQPYIVRGAVGVNGSGKIHAGQKALIKLSAYPSQEFGSLQGQVTSRSMVAIDSTFVIQITLTNGLHTNAGKVIPEQPQIEGIAEIITEDKSLFDRLFENIYGKMRR